MITFPFWFKILLGLFVFLIITGTIRLIFKNKYIDSIKELPDEKMEKLTKSYSFLLFMLKMFLWAIPLNLFLTLQRYLACFNDLLHSHQSLFSV